MRLILVLLFVRLFVYLFGVASTIFGDYSYINLLDNPKTIYGVHYACNILRELITMDAISIHTIARSRHMVLFRLSTNINMFINLTVIRAVCIICLRSVLSMPVGDGCARSDADQQSQHRSCH